MTERQKRRVERFQEGQRVTAILCSELQTKASETAERKAEEWRQSLPADYDPNDP